MKPIHVIPLSGGGSRASPSEPGLNLLEFLGASLARTFRTPCQVRPEVCDVSFAWDASREQYYSSAILRHLDGLSDPDARILGVATCDLFVPVLTFVFGEAQLEGNCAAVSLARLREEFYGLPARDPLLRERLLKAAIHELGHTFRLRHCADWQCVMSSSHSVERLDVKGSGFCAACRKLVFSDRLW